MLWDETRGAAVDILMWALIFGRRGIRDRTAVYLPELVPVPVVPDVGGDPT